METDGKTLPDISFNDRMMVCFLFSGLMEYAKNYKKIGRIH